MRYRPTEVEGVVVVELEEREDERGSFARTFDIDEFGALGIDLEIVQANVSFNHVAGTMRGLHRQRPPHAEGKLVRCTAGAIIDVAVDVRLGSPSYGAHVLVELSSANRLSLLVPPYVAHGYLTLEDHSEVTYQVSGRYAPESEEGYRYNEPTFAIEWPRAIEVISKKDASWPLLDGEGPAGA